MLIALLLATLSAPPSSSSSSSSSSATAPAPFEKVPHVATLAAGGAPSLFAAKARPLPGRGVLCDADPVVLGDGEGAYVVDVGDGKGDVVVALDDGASGDPCVAVFDAKTQKHLATLNATVLVVPGNGALFSTTTTNTWAATQRKWRLENGALKEVAQPLLALTDLPQPFRVGCPDGKLQKISGVWSRAPLLLRAAPDDKAAEVATVAAGAEARVLGREFVAADKDVERPRWVLVQTTFGLVGWARPVLARDAPADNVCFARRGD